MLYDIACLKVPVHLNKLISFKLYCIKLQWIVSHLWFIHISTYITIISANIATDDNLFQVQIRLV